MNAVKGNVAPTQAKMTELKHAVNVAKNAASMLQKKAQVFDMYLKDYAKKLESNTELVEHVMQEAFIALAEARYVFYPMHLSVFAETMVEMSASVQVYSFNDRFFGNARFYQIIEGDKDNEIWPMAGLAKGGEQIAKVKSVFRKAAEILVGQITLRNVFMSLLKAKEAEMRKVVVIDRMLIPQILHTIAHIVDYLDDVERDDNYRYKLVKKMYSRKL